MTVEYTTSAKTRVEEYLQAVADRLKASESVDAEEVVSDLKGHIERELSGLSQPVSDAHVNEVLGRLGPPEQVVDEEDITWWRRMILSLRRGPEDWRLAYLSFGVLILGTLIAGPFGILGSFLLSRAAISIAGEPKPPAKKWLIYPSLVIVYSLIALIAFIGLLWPAYALGGLVAMLNRGHGSLLHKGPFFGNDGLGMVMAVLAGAASGLAVWWSLLWVVWHSRPTIIRGLVKPFAEKWTGRTFGKLVLGVWALAIGLAVAAIMLWLAT